MHPLLQLCARIDPHPLQQDLLTEACAGFNDRGDNDHGDLIHQAEAHGMAPLLLRHLTAAGCDPPVHFLRNIRLLSLRHRQTNNLLIKTLGGVLRLLEAEGIPALVLKGAALCQTLYPEPGLRPMRDIDLLLEWDDALPAHALLRRHGFFDPAVATPVDHLHLAALYQKVDGMRVCLELHRSLFPDCPPCPERMDFTELYRNAEPFVVDTAEGVTGYTLATEEMLQHLYQHGFHAPLPYNPFKLISAADIVGFVEKRLDTIDWDRIQTVYPHLMAALPYLHHLTPWNDAVRERLSFREEAAPTGVGASFTGWPRRKLAERKGRGISPILRDTFFPPAWWLRIYYAPVGRFGHLWSLLVEHPGHVFWWVKLYWDIFLQANLPPEIGPDLAKRRSVVTVMRNAGSLVAAMYRKIK